LTIAYLINQYPQTSQSFIRREIAALEARGLAVLRYTLRAYRGPLVDPADELERERTRPVLGVGPWGLFAATFKAIVRRPSAFSRALALAVQVGRGSEVGIVKHAIYLAEACVLLGWLAEAGVGHLHAHFGTNSATVAMLCRELGGPPYSVTVHGPEEFDSPRALALGEKVGRSAFTVAISEFTRSQLCRWASHDDWAKIRVVRCGVDRAFLDADRVPIPDAPRLVCVGRIVEQKGPLLLVEAVGRLRDEGVDCEVVLVGDGPLRVEVERLSARLGLGDRVRLVGSLGNAEVRRAVLDARALVLPSFAEGLPVVLMEALALGRPVISTYVAGIPELVEPGRNGWLVPAGSAEALAVAIREAVQAPTDRLEAMGRLGAARAAARHDVDAEAARLAGHFADSVGRPRIDHHDDHTRGPGR